MRGLGLTVAVLFALAGTAQAETLTIYDNWNTGSSWSSGLWTQYGTVGNPTAATIGTRQVGKIAYQNSGGVTSMIATEFSALDSEQFLLVQTSNNTSPAAIIYSRWTDSTNNYSVRLAYDGTLRLFEGATQLGNSATVDVPTVSNWDRLRFRTTTVGSSVELQGRAYRAGTAEPAWAIDFIDETPQTGTSVGLGAYTDSGTTRYAAFDDYAIANLDSVIVPLPPAGWAGLVLFAAMGLARRLRRV
jgi:hypothetical protein